MTLAILVVLLWVPFGLNLGPDTDTWNIHANPEHYPWVVPSLLRPFVYFPYRLAGLFFPESFVGYNLLVALLVLGKGLLMFRLLDRVRQGRPAFALLAAALFAIYPAGTLMFRANMVAYQAAVLCLLAAARGLVAYHESGRWTALAGMLAGLVLALGIVETIVPVVLIAPLLLVWKDGRLSGRILRTSALWWALPLALTAYTAHVLSQDAAVASYQSERIMVPAGGLALELLRSLAHVLGQHFWTGFHRGASQMGAAPAAHTAIALTAGVAVGLVLWRLERDRSPLAAGSSAPREGLVLATLVAATWVGYSPYFLTYLRLASYRTFFFSAAAASIGVALGLDSACRRLRPLLPVPARAVLLPAAAGCLVALAMMNAVSDVAAWDRYSRDEQALVVEVVRRLPAVRSDTFIAILEGRNARFEHKYYVWFYQNALRLVYGDRSIHVTLCFRDVRPRDRERPSCDFRDNGVHVRNPIGLAESVWSYDRTILLARRPGGRMEVLPRVPGLSSSPPDYAPQALFDDVVPPPDRLHSYLKDAPALVRSQPP